MWLTARLKSTLSTSKTKRASKRTFFTKSFLALRLKFEYSTVVEFSPSVGRHNVLLRCLPAREAFQRVHSEALKLSEGFVHKESKDGFGNRIVVGSYTEAHSQFVVISRGVVDMDTYCIPDSAPHPAYSLPSRLTTPSREMKSLLPRRKEGFLNDCLAIAHRVHQHIVYTPGVTNMLTTADDVFRHRKGVCQDYAHLMIALCRMRGMPARYVCGLMMGEGQTHAWVEVHDGQCWYAFDPTNDTAIATGYIKLAHGRDAMDCPVSRGVYMGVAREETFVNVTVKEI